jgi:predicted O-methyltransferase YrrM
MTEQINQNMPAAYFDIDTATKAKGFSMASDPLTGSLLRTLAASKLSGKFLELGTGSGLATSWILDGMDAHSTLVSFDNDQSLLDIASSFLGHDKRLSLIHSDGADWVHNNKGQKFDYIFADTWHGKYLLLDEVLEMLSPGGLYIVDDMLPQPNWPEGHKEKADHFIETLKSRSDLFITKQNWASGIVIGVRK